MTAHRRIATRRHTHDRTERDARRAARRTELLEAAATVIRRDGPSVSMEAIAAAAGITKPIVYKHFGDRDGLVLALGERFATELVGALTASLDQEIPPEQLLRSTVDGYLAFVERDPNIYRFLVSSAGSDAGQFVAGGLVAQISSQIAVVLGEQLRSLGLDSGAAEPQAFGIVGMVHLAGDWWLERRTMSRGQLVTYLCDLLWHGFSGIATNALTAPAAPATPAPEEAP